MAAASRKLPILHALPAGGPVDAPGDHPDADVGGEVVVVAPESHVGELLQVGELAKAAGKTVRAIHHYEEVGLLRPSARSKGRFRLYDVSAVTRVRWIGKLHDLGMSLAAIQEVLSSWEASPSAPGAMAAVRATYAEKLEATRAQIARLRDLERELEASLEYLDTCDRCDPAELIRACSACQVRDAGDLAPELVAGLSLPQPGAGSWAGATTGCSCHSAPSPSPLTPPPLDPASLAD
jgi:DNA-binding transcriptional MerR regulator